MGEDGPGGGEGRARLPAGERRIFAGESAGAREIRCVQGERRGGHGDVRPHRGSAAAAAGDGDAAEDRAAGEQCYKRGDC